MFPEALKKSQQKHPCVHIPFCLQLSGATRETLSHWTSSSHNTELGEGWSAEYSGKGKWLEENWLFCVFLELWCLQIGRSSSFSRGFAPATADSCCRDSFWRTSASQVFRIVQSWLTGRSPAFIKSFPITTTRKENHAIQYQKLAERNAESWVYIFLSFSIPFSSIPFYSLHSTNTSQSSTICQGIYVCWRYKHEYLL